jgi:hypothetical protein
MGKKLSKVKESDSLLNLTPPRRAKTSTDKDKAQTYNFSVKIMQKLVTDIKRMDTTSKLVCVNPDPVVDNPVSVKPADAKTKLSKVPVPKNKGKTVQWESKNAAATEKMVAALKVVARVMEQGAKNTDESQILLFKKAAKLNGEPGKASGKAKDACYFCEYERYYVTRSRRQKQKNQNAALKVKAAAASASAAAAAAAAAAVPSASADSAPSASHNAAANTAVAKVAAVPLTKAAAKKAAKANKNGKKTIPNQAAAAVRV